MTDFVLATLGYALMFFGGGLVLLIFCWACIRASKSNESGDL